MPRWQPSSTEEVHAPALLRAQALQDRAASLGFDWPDAQPVWEKLDEELAELREAIASGNPAALRHELGDVLFTIVNLSRFLKVDPDGALIDVCVRFQKRLDGVQTELDKAGLDWTACSLDALERLWQKAKLQEASGNAGE